LKSASKRKSGPPKKFSAFKNLQSKQVDIEETGISNQYWSQIEWNGDIGFFYQHIGTDGKVSGRYHALDSDSSNDPIVYPPLTDPTMGLGFSLLDVSKEKKKWLLVTIASFSTNAIYYKEVPSSGLPDPNTPWKPFPGVPEYTPNVYSYLYHQDESKSWFVKTTNQAPHGKIDRIDIDEANSSSVRSIVGEDTSSVLSEVALVGDFIVTTYDVDARSDLRVFNLEGDKVDIPFETPGASSLTLAGFDKDSGKIIVGYQSFASPFDQKIVDLKEKNSSKQFSEQKIEGFNLKNFQTEQVFYTSEDGTRIPWL